MILTCPVCGENLSARDKALVCGLGHSFDVAKQHYVNLLLSNAPKEKRHGDDKAMVAARSSFLGAGYYDKFRDGIVSASEAALPRGAAIMDAGCGEGFYTSAVKAALGADMCGVDISKTALIAAAKRDSALTLAVSSVNRLPVGDGCCDGVMSIFAPCDAVEFARILKPGGILIRGLPLERHLWGLKQAIYDAPYLNPPVDAELPGFEIIARQDIEYKITLKCGADIHNLFMMTPYYYKTGRSDQEKLDSLLTLDTELGFAVVTYRKI